MKRQIAVFLGELAEELGWEPELEEQRVKLDERTAPPIEMHTPNANSPPAAPRRLGGSADDLSAQVKQLRSSLSHLSSEVTQLRAEMARLKDLPLPPDTRRDAPLTASGADVRPWPAHLVRSPTTEPAPPVPAARATDPEPPRDAVAPGSPARPQAPVPDGMVVGPVSRRDADDTPAAGVPSIPDGMVEAPVAEPVVEPKPDLAPSPEPEQEAGSGEASIVEEAQHAVPDDKELEKPELPVVTDLGDDSALDLFPTEPTAGEDTKAGQSAD